MDNNHVARKRLILLGIPVILATTTIIFIMLTIPTGWEKTLRRYLDYQKAYHGLSLTPVQTRKASQPWNLSAEMSAYTVGDGVCITDARSKDSQAHRHCAILPKKAGVDWYARYPRPHRAFA